MAGLAAGEPLPQLTAEARALGLPGAPPEAATAVTRPAVLPTPTQAPADLAVSGHSMAKVLRHDAKNPLPPLDELSKSASAFPGYDNPATTQGAALAGAIQSAIK